MKPVSIDATDSWGNIGTATIEVELRNIAAALDKVPPHDSFDETALDVSKWNTVTCGGGAVNQDGKLMVTTNSKQATSNAMVQSVWNFTGDFDV